MDGTIRQGIFNQSNDIESTRALALDFCMGASIGCPPSKFSLPESIRERFCLGRNQYIASMRFIVSFLDGGCICTDVRNDLSHHACVLDRDIAAHEFCGMGLAVRQSRLARFG